MKLSQCTGVFSVLAAAAWIVLSTGCKDSNTISSPHLVQGTSATPTPAVAAQVSEWSVTDQAVGDSGPDFCIWTAKVGMVFHGSYTISRRGSSVSFTPADIVDWESYAATLQGTSFSASNPPLAENDCAHYLQSSTLAGSFSPDGTHLTATETWSFRLDSGELKTVTFQWSGVRQ